VRRARRPKPSKLAENYELRRVVEAKLGEWWSPEQVAHWLKRTYGDHQEMREASTDPQLDVTIRGNSPKCCKSQ